MTKILVIEDQDIVREGILDILRLEQFQVIAAENGEVGIQLARDYRPDLIICDVVMPELDGHEVLSTLRQDPEMATVPFIFLTARADRAAQRQGMNLGADDYLTKPFTKTELLEAIATQCGKRAATQHYTQKKLDELRNNIALALPHELHTPLTSMIGLTDLLLEEQHLLTAEERSSMLQSIRTSAVSLYRLTQNFLLYAELELLATNPDRVAALRNGNELSDITSAITTTAQDIAAAAGRSADLHLLLIESTVRMPEHRLCKLAQELIDNAFKFSAIGTPVFVTTQVDRTQLSLRIINWGRGFSSEQIANVGAYMQFERKLFEQQGSGLGLTIAKRLAELYGGSLTIDSVPDQQTIVSVLLPL